jgi:O-antigen/teichoic acid export membrane protein
VTSDTEVDGSGAGIDGASVDATVGTMFRRDSLYMVASSLQLLAGVVITPLLTRVLGLHQYGIFAADLALLYVLYYTANLGLNIGIQRLFSQPDGDLKSRNLLAAALVLVSCITAIVYATGPLWSPRLGFGDFPLSTRLTVVWSGLFAMTWICLAILRCNEKLAVFTTVCLLQSIVGVGVGTIVAHAGNRMATDVLWCTISAQAVAVIISFVTITPRWRGILDLRTVSSTLTFSIPIVPLQISTFILSASDRIVILRDLGPNSTGRYQVAYTLGAVGVSMLTFLNLAWLPRIFAIADRVARSAVLAASRDGLYRLLVPVTIGIAMGGPLVLHIWAPRSFHTETLVPVVALVVASTIPVCTAFVHSRLLLSEGRSATVAFVTLVAATINVALNLVLVPQIGINGSALATLLSYGLLATGMAAISRSVLTLPRPPLGLWAALAATEGVVLLSSSLPIHGTAAALRLVVTGISVGAALVILRRLQRG